MGRESNNAAKKDAQIKLSKEESASSMGQRSNFAAKKDAQIKLKREECVIGMGQSPNDAAKKDAQIKLKEEDYVGAMEEGSTVMLLNAPTMPSLESLLESWSKAQSQKMQQGRLRQSIK